MIEGAWIETVHDLSRAGKPFAIITVIGAKGSTPRGLGAKMILETDGTFHGTIGGGQLERLVLDDARKALSEAVSRPRDYPLCFRTGQCCGGAAEVFIEIVGLSPVLYLFGAGHVGRSLCQVLSGTPFTVHAIDERPEWIQSPELPSGVIRHQMSWRPFTEKALWDAQRVYVAVMTHEHQMDLDIINDVISRRARFIGLIGSETKWQRFQQRLNALGAEPDAVARVHCPIGSAVFGKAPREVAVSIAAQLLEQHYAH